MLIDDAEFERRMKSGKNLLNSLGIAGPARVTELRAARAAPLSSVELRVVAGTAAHFSSAREVAEQLGITEQQVRSAKHSDSVEVRSRVERSVETVQDLALKRTLEAMELLTPETVRLEKPKDIAIIAGAMSKVHANVRGKDAVSNVQFVVYAPSLKNETHYEVVEASG